VLGLRGMKWTGKDKRATRRARKRRMLGDLVPKEEALRMESLETKLRRAFNPSQQSRRKKVGYGLPKPMYKTRRSHGNGTGRSERICQFER